MRRVIAGLALLSSVACGVLPDVKAGSSCSSAFMAQTKSCLNAYFSGFGLNPARLPPFEDYIQKIVDMTEQNGPNGVEFFCKYEVTVESCLGYLFNSPCMTAASFQDMYNMNLAQAIDYSTDFPVRAYMCNNKDFVEENLACFNDINDNHFDERRQCAAAVEKDIKNVKNGDYCSPWAGYLTCTDDFYVKYCGPQVKGYVCNVIKEGINWDSQGICMSILPLC
ncbi:hypothetical protein PFISCL1PPCAC_4303 [Pristionchus fissidentatus]|uniref:Uncharacterized protein n=1 Tax=Pristionchus fissidentatus TaxID=1538716 RepID=A0AAV5V0D1_9BILA|nr:hypothetical protein PFISCL1PPCAC_4303 [Pristionchus fissidentatus]